MWPAGSSRVHRLRSLGLFFLRPGVLRESTVRILLRLSHDSFMPKRFWTSGGPTCPRRFSPSAPPPCRVTTFSIGWCVAEYFTDFVDMYAWHLPSECIYSASSSGVYSTNTTVLHFV